MTSLGGKLIRSASQRTRARRLLGAGPSMSFASLRRLCPDRCGITSLACALTFPIIMAFIVGTLELDRYMFLQLQLQSAVNDASRYGLTGVANTDAANQVVCPIASGFGPVPP